MGEALLLTLKIKQNGKVYENGSRQIIQSIDEGKVRFRSGLVLSKEDGRFRQGDVVTTYKSHGASKLDMIRLEDNQSIRAMVGQEDLHVGFTRRPATSNGQTGGFYLTVQRSSKPTRRQHYRTLEKWP